LSGTINPYPFEASNHLMTPEISTRLTAAASAAKVSVPKFRSIGADLSFEANPLEPVILLDSNPSDPMTPDPNQSAANHFCDDFRSALLIVGLQDDTTRIY